MSSRPPIAIGAFGAAFDLFACGSSAPTQSSVPDHPTSCSITATFATQDGAVLYPTPPGRTFTALVDWQAR